MCSVRFRDDTGYLENSSWEISRRPCGSLRWSDRGSLSRGHFGAGRHWNGRTRKYFSIFLFRCSLHFYCERHSVSASEAERRNTSPRSSSLHGVEQGRQDARAAGADRMAERDRASVDVDASGIERQLPDNRHHLRGEGFVDLKKV